MSALAKPVTKTRTLISHHSNPSQSQSNPEIALEFLPIPRCKSVILTVINCFSKAYHVIALPKMPSASSITYLFAWHSSRDSLGLIPTIYFLSVEGFELFPRCLPLSHVGISPFSLPLPWVEYYHNTHFSYCGVLCVCIQSVLPGEDARWLNTIEW